MRRLRDIDVAALSTPPDRAELRRHVDRAVRERIAAGEVRRRAWLTAIEERVERDLRFMRPEIRERIQ